ncbi:MAG: hypothetical protein JXA10_07425 [Anaerolineae bacterium]|nr:hypothetical protein [Anaerolineae bacterium]
MADNVQAVIGQLLVVGGRAVRMPPPGALAETAPRRVPRAREGDTFFILVTPAGESRIPAASFEQMAQLGADVYFGSSGGITGGLREALTAIHQHARDHQPVNALAVVLRGSDLYTARGGKTFGVIYRSDQAATSAGLAFIPADRHDPLEVNLPPLGTAEISDEPDIQLGRYTVTPNTVLLLADESLIAKANETWRFVLSRGTVESVIDALRGIAGLDIAASVIRFLAPGASDPSGTIPQASSRSPRTDFARAAKPTVSVPISPESVTPEKPAQESTPSADQPTASPPRPAKPMTPYQPPKRRADKSAMPFTVDDEPAPAASDSAPFIPDSLDNLLADESRADTNNIAPDASPAPAQQKRGPSPIAQASARIKHLGRDIIRGVLALILGIITFFTTLFERILPAPDNEGNQGIPTSVAVGLAILIPLVIVIVVVGLALSEQGKTDYELIMERAQAKHQEALTLSNQSCDNRALRPLWVEVLSLAQQAAEYRPNDLDVLVMAADARNYLDCYDGVVRRNLGLMHTFAPDAELVGPIVNGGVDLFVLDRTNSAVYHDTLNANGDGLTSRSDDPILYRGYSTTSGEYTVQNLIDIEWLTSGGTVHDNVLIALDSNGVLWAYSPSFFTTVQQLITSGWENPVAIAVFDQWLYVLDAGADQVWRYTPPAGENAYSVAAEEYFNGEEIPDLENAVDIAISSDEGAVYILFRDGIVRKYRRNTQGYVEEQPFVYKEQPAGALASGTALFIDNDPASVSLYIVDQENATIYRTTFSGRYNRGIRPQNLPDAFNVVSGIYADSVVRNNMYVVAGNKLYHFGREQ